MTPPPTTAADSPGDLAAVLSAMLAEARRAILRTYAPDSCIATVRIACAVLSRFGIEAVPLATRVVAMNDLYHRLATEAEGLPDPALLQEWSARGAYSVGVGYGDSRPGKWAGHLVALVERDTALDLSIDQASRPERGIVLEPLAFGVPRWFRHSPRRGLAVRPPGAHLVYHAVPGDASYRDAPDWRHPRYRPVAQEVYAAVAARLRAGGSPADPPGGTMGS